MKREDIKPEELEGLLVAFADGELDEPKFSQVAELISEHSDLARKVEEYIYTGDHLKDFFDTQYVKAPAHVAEQILQIADKAEASRTAANEASSEPSGSNVINFSSFKKLCSKLAITTQSLTQMAAALVLGVVIAPQLFDESIDSNSQSTANLETSGNTEIKQAVKAPNVKLRGAQIEQFIKANSAPKVAQIFASQGEAKIMPGEEIIIGEGFQLTSVAPFDGIYEVFDISNLKNMKKVGAGQMQKGDLLVVPEKGRLNISNQTEFSARYVFKGENESIQLDANFAVRSD